MSGVEPVRALRTGWFKSWAGAVLLAPNSTVNQCLHAAGTNEVEGMMGRYTCVGGVVYDPDGDVVATRSTALAVPP